MKRRELFNAMMNSQKGQELLRASAAKSLPPNKINPLMANLAFRTIEEYSDDEDDDLDESNTSKKTLWNDAKTTIRHKVVDRVRQYNDDDIFDYDERYPLETELRGNGYENTFQERNSSLRPDLSEICLTADDDHEPPYDNYKDDDEDHTDEEDIYEKDFIRLHALKRYLAPCEGSIESDADWFDTYEQDEWSNKAEGPDADFDMDSMMDIDDA